MQAWNSFDKNNQLKIRNCQRRNARKDKNDRKAENKSYSCKIPKSQMRNQFVQEREKNYTNDIVDETDPDQVGNNKYLL